MNKLLLRNPSSNTKGITLIEILIGLAVLVILMSFAMPAVSGAAVKAEMSAASENIQFSIHAARQTARVNESGVTMYVPINEESGPGQTISFSSANLKKVAQVRIPQFQLSPEIMAISDQESYLFDDRGLAINPGTILLVSTIDESITSAIVIN